MQIRLMILAVLLLSGCGLLDGLDPGIDTVEQVEGFIGEPLPDSAADVQFEVLGFNDLFLRLRFTAPAADVEQFMEALGITALTEGDNTNFFQASDLAWWQPQTSTAPLRGEVDRREVNRFYRALVDQTAGEMWTVYLVVFSQ